MGSTMNDEELLRRVTTDPAIMVGKPTIRGMRITVEQVLRALAANISVEDLLDDLPELEPADIQACVLYAAQLVQEERVYSLGA